MTETVFCFVIDDLMNKIPKKADLLKLFSSASAEWHLIGTALGVEHADLMPLPGQALNNLSMIFDRWFSKYENVKWETICSLCEDYAEQLGSTKAKVSKFLSSQKAHDTYIDTKDFDN